MTPGVYMVEGLSDRLEDGDHGVEAHGLTVRAFLEGVSFADGHHQAQLVVVDQDLVHFDDPGVVEDQPMIGFIDKASAVSIVGGQVGVHDLECDVSALLLPHGLEQVLGTKDYTHSPATDRSQDLVATDLSG